VIRASVQLDRGDFRLDVDFEAAGAVTGVFGPSGAGKTTLINLIAGLERPDAGSIAVDGRTLFDGGEHIDVPAHRRRLGVVFQEHRLLPHYSVRGNLLYGRRRDRGGLDPVVELLELGPLLERRVAALSGGERQRVALGRALLSEPKLLLLDEPLASLDHRLRRQIIPYLRRVRDDLALPMLYVSHDLTELLQLTDRILVLEQGRSVGHGRYPDVVHQEGVLPVLHARGMSNVLAARVVAHETDDGITVLELRCGPAGEAAATPLRLSAPPSPSAEGTEVTVSIRPWDVALAAAPVDGVSIQNQCRGTVRRCTTRQRSALVEVDVGPPLLVEISRRSVASLGIEPGRPVVCLIKSHAIQYV
jgi:molybdate transport system ATP-binding protein